MSKLINFENPMSELAITSQMSSMNDESVDIDVPSNQTDHRKSTMSKLINFENPMTELAITSQMSSMNDESVDIDDRSIIEQSSSSSKRPRRNSSIAWDFFDKLPVDENGKRHSQCKRCGHILRADSAIGTSNLKKHIPRCPKREMSDIIPISQWGGSMSMHPIIDQKTYRDKMSIAMIKHNYSFMFVEHEGIRDLHTYLNPDAKSITRNTAEKDVLDIYEREREKLKSALKLIPSKFCLTSDLWTSYSTDGYMTVTAHYVDENWVLQKRILNFQLVPPPHNGPVLAEKLIDLLKEWGIDKRIFTLTLDDASYNDGLVDVVKNHQSIAGALVCGGDLFHVRCGAHILNLIVQEGLKVIDDSVYKIRESVKYVRGGEIRKAKFAECIRLLSLSVGKKIRQDCPTRWNSTYLMLESALVYRRAFSHLQLLDTNFKTCPSIEEWNRVERITEFLKPFFEITTLFSGSRYPTTNLYFRNVWKIQMSIMEEMRSADEYMSLMASNMMEKFNKYWENYSTILSIAIILDPRYKILYVKFCFKKLNIVTWRKNVNHVRENLYMLFEEYVRSSSLDVTTSLDVTISQASTESCRGNTVNNDGGGDDIEEFEKFESQQYTENRNKSQLDLYLEEPNLDRKQNSSLDVLDFWKSHRTRYPELALMARDILSIPITTVASESAFSVGGRIFGKYRSSLLPKNVEALICAQDWLYGVPPEDSDESSLIEEF